MIILIITFQYFYLKNEPKRAPIPRPIAPPTAKGIPAPKVPKAIPTPAKVPKTPPPI